MSETNLDRAPRTAMPTAATLLFDRLIRAPRARVWAAWTNAEEIVKWWGPDGFTAKDCTIEPETNGRFSLVLVAPDGSEHACDGTIAAFEPQERLVIAGFRDDRHPCRAGLPPAATVTLSLSAEGDATRLRLQTEFRTPNALQSAADAGYRAGWQDSFNHLAVHLGAPHATTENEIRARLRAWSAALEAKDADGLVADYDDDCTMLGHWGAWHRRGPAAIRSMWSKCLPYLPERIHSDHRELEILISPDMALIHGCHGTIDVATGTPLGGMYVRISLVFARRGGNWRCVHEHVSLPFDPETMQVLPVTAAQLAHTQV